MLRARRFLRWFFLLSGFACLNVLSSHAAYISDVLVTKIASATVNSGPGSLTVTVKKISDNSPATQIGWSNPGTGWTEADHYLEIAYNSNDVGWGVQIYTDNHNPAADPAYTGSTTQGWEGQGLVGVSNSTVAIALAWTARDDPGARPAITTDSDGILISNNGWAYFKDPMQTAGSNPFNYGEEYITIVHSGGLADNAGNRTYGATSPVYIYLIGNFKGALNQVYRTNQLTLELYHE